MASAARPLLLLLLLACAGVARAACGLAFCPLPEPPGGRAAELGLLAREAGFDLAGTEGTYTELIASARTTVLGRLAVGLHAPFVLLHRKEVTEAGAGNLLAFAEWRFRPPAWLMALAVGSQLEVPTGDADHGLGDDHFMAAPYVSLAFHAGPFILGTWLGTAATLHGDHSEGHGSAPAAGGAPVFVHPHEEWEAFYRLSTGLRLLDGRFLPEAHLDGQRVLSHPADDGVPRHYLAAGISLPWSFGPAAIGPHAAFPLLTDPRESWAVGLRLDWTLRWGGAPATGEI